MIIHQIMRSGKSSFYMTMEEDEENNIITCKAEVTYDLSKKSQINEIVKIMKKDKYPLLEEISKIQNNHRQNIKEEKYTLKLFDDDYIDYIEKKKEEIDNKNK